jgi:chemotaxis protein methyltransferase CheR
MSMAVTTPTNLTEDDLDYVRTLVRERAAIVLDADKQYLIESRLDPLARKAGYESLTEMIRDLRSKPYGRLHHQAVEAMTTNETSWFRDRSPYEAMRQHILPDLLQKRAASRTLTIWSAASSTGQEPYSTAIMIHDHFPQLHSWNLRILASDFSEEVLNKAREARYTQLEINRGLPAALLVKHFEHKGTHWQVKDHIRNMVKFGVVNLAQQWPPMPPVDIVLLRNVMIYFDIETKRSILAGVRRILRPGGYLLLGNAETTLNIDERFRRVEFGKASCYQVA